MYYLIKKINGIVTDKTAFYYLSYAWECYITSVQYDIRIKDIDHNYVLPDYSIIDDNEM